MEQGRTDHDKAWRRSPTRPTVRSSPDRAGFDARSVQW